MEPEIPKRAILITGAAGGIGQAVASFLSFGGWPVGLIDTRSEPLERKIAVLKHLKRPVAFRLASTMDSEALRVAFASLAEELDGIGGLVTAAGVPGRGTVEEVTESEWREAIDANLTGTFLACQTVLPYLRANGQGHIINILSIASREAFAGQAAYCASKWGAYGFTKVLAQEVRGDGIRVSAILPGAVATGFWDSVPDAPDRDSMLDPQWIADAVHYALRAPIGVSVDEVVVMPPQGILSPR